MHRKHFQFSLRALFILTALAAIWLGYHMNWIRQRHDYQKWLCESHFTFSGQSQSKRGLPWSLRLLGEAPVTTIDFSDSDTNSAEHHRGVSQISSLFPEAEIAVFPTAEFWQRIKKIRSHYSIRPAAPESNPS